MKKILISLLCLVLLLALAGCGTPSQKVSAAQQQCEDFLMEIRRGKGLADQLLSEGQRGGIMEEVLGSIRYEILSQKKQEDGSMAVTKQPVKEEWMGDRTQDYADRYGYYFPGEREAKGLPEEEASGGWGK